MSPRLRRSRPARAERRTFIVQTGVAPRTKAADARKNALEVFGQIEAGLDRGLPKGSALPLL
jgi:hypothetical protein